MIGGHSKRVSATEISRQELAYQGYEPEVERGQMQHVEQTAGVNEATDSNCRTANIHATL